jgi:nucleotide-binding universal stress UspA family protein
VRSTCPSSRNSDARSDSDSPATQDAFHGNATPSRIRHLVVAVDGSPASRDGLALAAEVAERTGAHLTVVHVRHVPAGASLSSLTAEQVVRTQDELEAEVRTTAREALGAGRSSWDLVVRAGSPGEEVLRVVKELGADLVVVVSNRHGHLHNVLLGSTSAYLASHSPVPVLVARPAMLVRHE